MVNDALCFDLFGTLCEKTAVYEAFSETVAEVTDLEGEDINALYSDWQDRRSEYICRTAAMNVGDTYRGIAERSLVYTTELHGVALSEDTQAKIVGAHTEIEARSEVPNVLEKLSRDFETAVLSNGDPGLLRDIVANAGIDRYLDRVISAGDSGEFKPAPSAYHHAAEVLDRPVGTCWLVSAHSWDARGAAQAGMLGAWVNRDGHPGHRIGRPPTLVTDSFEALVDELS